MRGLRRLGREAMPAVLRVALRNVLEAAAGASAAVPVLVARVRKEGAPRVFYGHRRIPALDEESYGGIVKFQHMQRFFANSPSDFNLVYMVSSRPPRGAVAIARAARLRGARVVWNQDGVAYPGWHGPGWERTNAPMAAMLRLADHVFYQSQFCRETADRFVGVQPRRWEVLHNPVDTSLFTPREGLPPPGLVLLLGGSQYQRYRLRTALAVLAAVRRERPHASLVVTGRLIWTREDRARRETDELIRALDLDGAVTFTGPYTQVQAPHLYRRAHILLHTKYNDPCPGLVVEALACGLPVVYSRSGGVPELVGDDAGEGVPTEISWQRDIPPDPQRMAAAVLRVVAKLPRYAEAARQRAVERFDLRPWMRRHREAFESLL